MATFDDDFVVPTSDPLEDLLIPIPSSDPYEEVLIPGFSQRDDTRAEVDAIIQSLHTRAVGREIRRTQREEKAARRLVLSPSPYSRGAMKKLRQSGATSHQDLDLELDLLRLQCKNLEEQCGNLRAECDRLRNEFHQHQLSLTFFQRETGRWRWAAANAGHALQLR
ncbi:hypothetical protein B0H14DRAFT_3757942 [Mycena olivaceomarginata]|nr:hypothetical protein B0H14DRAFT_3757942 [Mycena olivaceomarginata]